MEQLTHIQTADLEVGAREEEDVGGEAEDNKITTSSGVIPLYYDTSVIKKWDKGGWPGLKPFSNVNQHVREAAQSANWLIESIYVIPGSPPPGLPSNPPRRQWIWVKCCPRSLFKYFHMTTAHRALQLKASHFPFRPRQWICAVCVAQTKGDFKELERMGAELGPAPSAALSGDYMLDLGGFFFSCASLR